MQYDNRALVSNGWNESLTSFARFVRVVRAVGLAVAEPGLGDAGVVIMTVKLPNVTQDGFWVGMERVLERETERDAA